MHDPYFDATCADIRGFDLGDDAPMLALIDDADDLTSDERLFRGVLRARAERHADAAEDFIAVVDAGDARSMALYLAAHCRAAADDLEGAGQLLGRAEQAAREDHLVAPADLAHGRGRLAWLAEDPDAALQAVRLGLDADDGSALRWVDAASLHVAAGGFDRALQCVQQALALESDLADAHYEAAVIATLAAPHGNAAAKWRDAFAIDPGLRDTAAADPRLAEARDMPALAAVIGPAPAPNLRWMDDAPRWLRQLCDAPGLHERGIRWLDEDERRDHAARVAAVYETGMTGTMMTEATLAQARNRLTTMVPVARLPSRPTRDGRPDDVELWIDEAEPERLWLSWSVFMPPLLWVDVGTTADGIVAALDPLTSGRPTRVDMTRTHRVFIGYVGDLVVPHPVTGELEAAGIMQLEQHLSLCPYLESGAWGAAWVDDPWPDVIPEQPDRAAKIETRQQTYAAQSDAHVWSMSRRLRHSRAYLTLEVHHDDLVVLELRYAENPHPEVIAALNETFEAEYPTDIPLDAMAAVLGLTFDSAAQLQPRLAELDAAGDEEQLAGLLYVLSALRHGDLDAHVLWHEFAGHARPLIRATIVNIAVAYNFESLLEERTLSETDEELRGEIERMLDAGLAPPHWDPYDPIEIEDPFDDELEDAP